jgi:radical SAM enzyme (TIGR01210 family)
MEPATPDQHGGIEERIRLLYDTFGQRKKMGLPEPDLRRPLFFLHRPFLGDLDLLTIFNTKRCKYQCHFCHLPAKSPKALVSEEDILAQFQFVVSELKHSLSLITRFTMSNEGSILDPDTFPFGTLRAIVQGTRELRMVRRIVMETRLEFMNRDAIFELRRCNPRVTFDILTGFESKDREIRDEFLYKQEPISSFLNGLDAVAASGCDLTAYVLFKPSPYMTDEEAFQEAESSIDYLVEHCQSRRIGLTIRLNPMYAATGTKWAEIARTTPTYKPPRLTDVMKLAQKKSKEGLQLYIGISREGIDENWGSYLCREDYSDALIRPIKLFNERKSLDFGEVLGKMNTGLRLPSTSPAGSNG